MDAKENALRIVRFDHPERVVGAPPCADISYFGVNHESFENPRGHEVPVGTRWQDIWGVGWRKEMDGVMGYAVHHPLADLDFRGYRWPDPEDERLVGQVHGKAKSADRAEKFPCGSHRETLWERAYNLVGMDRLMMAFYDSPEAAHEILHRVMDFQVGVARHYLKAGVEMAGLGDDLGTQSGLLLSPEILNEFLVPEYRRLFALYREHGVLIGFHSCGHITPILEMFMDLGVNVLNPVQATANDLDEVRRCTQGRMALQGGVSSAVVVAGPPARIREEVRLRIRQLGRNGGYFCGPDQGMPWPEEHIRALREAVEEFGRYPVD